MIAHLVLEHTIATLTNWNMGKKYFHTLGFGDEAQLDQLKTFIFKNTNGQLTFWQVYINYFVKAIDTIGDLR